MANYLIRLLLVLVIVIHANFTRAQKDDNIRDIKSTAQEVLTMFEKFHCSPRAADNQLYRDIATGLSENLDPGNLFFTAADTATLFNYNDLKEELSGVNKNYSERVISLYRKRLNEAQKTISNFATTPFDFKKDETLFMKHNEPDYASDEKDLSHRVYLFMKLATLDRLTEDILKDSTGGNKTLALSGEPDERAVVVKKITRSITRRLESSAGFENYVRIQFYNAIADAFDPHSEFIGTIEKKKINRGWGGDAASFGIRIKENEKGDIVIAALVPGSSAWKSGDLNKGDVLTQIKWQNKPAVDLVGASLEEVEEQFAAAKGFKIQLTVLKPDGSDVTVTLGRFFSIATDDIVRAFILDGPERIGYIMLPSFYNQWESNDGSGCAKDVIRQTVKLVQEHVNGLIIDLRYNGGGSLQEANELASVFLDEGPLGLRKQKEGFLTTMKNPAHGVLYDDPVLILVNNESASASEYLASTLQDYHRAIIVGTPTYGKATAQRYLPADTTISKLDIVKAKYETEAKDEVKITISKLYRINGKSNQISGVQPDIFLPDADDSLQIREKYNHHVLHSDTLLKSSTYEAFAALPLKELAAKSATRVKDAHGFKIVDQLRELNAEEQRAANAPVSLNLDKYLDFSEKHIGLARKLAKELREDSTTLYTVKNTPESPSYFAKIETMVQEMNTIFCNRVARDVYVAEAYAIMKDYLQMKKK